MEKNMNNIIQFPFENLTDYRNQFSFINRNTKIMNEEGEFSSYPCIALYENETGIPILYTGLERYIGSLVLDELLDGETLAKRAVAVCNFLNYLLHKTTLNCIHECDIDTIRDYLKHAKVKSSGVSYNHDTWVRYRGFIFTFLKLYYLKNKDVLEFSYNGEVLQDIKSVQSKDKRRKVVLVQNSGLNVKGPTTTHKKNRILVYGYLDLLMYEAKKYDPEITLGIALQAYAGIREGETVNLTCGRVEKIRKQFAMISSIELNLLDTAPFFKNWSKKTKPGSIKKIRVQKVYDHFIRKIVDLYDMHIQMMESKGYDTSKDAPLFVNYQGNPMTVQTYSGRVKDLFYNYFLPALKLTCDKQNTWADNAAFIEVYEKEYPGAHMLRHWFTMYLITKAKLSVGEIAKWRGDTTDEAMMAYIHENSDIIEIYRESSYAFQSQILEDIL